MKITPNTRQKMIINDYTGLGQILTLNKIIINKLKYILDIQIRLRDLCFLICPSLKNSNF